VPELAGEVARLWNHRYRQRSQRRGV